MARFAGAGAANATIENSTPCLRHSADEAANDLIKNFRLLAVAKMAGFVDDVHLRTGIAVGDDFKQSVAALEQRGGIVVTPDEQRRLGEFALDDPIQSFFFMHCQVREELLPL